MPSLSHPLQFVLVALAGWVNQQQRDHRLSAGGEPRPARTARAQAFAVHGRSAPSASRESTDTRAIVTPGTLLAWHRLLIAKQYDESPRRIPGRPPVMGEIRALIVRMVTDNRAWGYTRSTELWRTWITGFRGARSPPILREHGLERAAELVKKTTWTEF